MFLKYPCNGCSNEIVAEPDDSNMSNTPTVPAYCLSCQDEKPANCLIVKTLSEVLNEENEQ